MFVVIHILDYSLNDVKYISLNFDKKGGFFLILDNISRLCKERGISIARLERESGLGNATVRGWGNSSPTVDNLLLVANYLGVTLDELLKGD